MLQIGDKVAYYRKHHKYASLVIEESTIVGETTYRYIIENPIKPYTPSNPRIIYRFKESVWKV